MVERGNVFVPRSSDQWFPETVICRLCSPVTSSRRSCLLPGLGTLDDGAWPWALALQCCQPWHPRTPGGHRLPTQLGIVSFHWASALGTDRQRRAADPCSRYPGLHSNRTIEPAENSEPILLPYLGSGTELHWVSLVRGTAGDKTQNKPSALASKEV